MLKMAGNFQINVGKPEDRTKLRDNLGSALKQQSKKKGTKIVLPQ